MLPGNRTIVTVGLSHGAGRADAPPTRQTAHVVVDEVCSWLGWAPWDVIGLSDLAARQPTSTLRLEEACASEILSRLRVPDEAIAEIASSAPAPRDEPEAWWLLERLYDGLVEAPGLPPPWPAPVPASDPLSRYFHLYAFLAAVPHVRALHTDRGISEEVTWDTLGDLGVQVGTFIDRHGRPGFDGAMWVWPHFRGTYFRLGRLQFEATTATFASGASANGARFSAGDPVVGVHIPPVGPLTPTSCEEAFERAGTFFARHFPEHPYRAATCTSWLLDEQLADYLPDTSNIVAFQRRFDVVGDRRNGDEDILRFAFGYLPASLDDLPQRTAVERAVVRHLKDGGHWRIREGWLEL